MGSLFGFVANFFGLTKLKLAILGGLLLSIVLLSLGIWFLWGQNQDLNKTLGRAELTIKTMELVIVQKDKDIKDITDARNRLDAVRAKNAELIENQDIKIRALKLGKQALTNAPQAETQATKLLNDRLRCIEIVTGTPFATSVSLNEVCPELFPVEVKP